MCGIEAARLKIAVFVISGAVAGLSGALYVFFYRYVSPAPFDLSASINLLIVCVVGGSGNAFGALLGAIAVTVIEVVLQNVFARGLGLPGQVETLAFGVIMVVILIRWPAGLWALLEEKWPRLVPERVPPIVALKQSGVSQNSDAVVRVSNVTKSFEGLRALGGVSFEIRSHEILGLIGPNGAGKSTLFNIITGLLPPTSGAVTLGGKSLPRPSRLAAHGVTRTFQHVKLVPELSVIENVALGSFYRGRAGFVGGMFGLDAGEEAITFRNAWRALEIVGLDNLAVLPAARLAMGQARMLEIARAIIGQPRLLLLDEPAAGLRTGEKLHLVNILHRLKRQGTSIMIVEHDMDLVMNSVDRVFVLDRGEGLASGSPATVREDPRVIAAYLGA
jgi:branched-chain amino acid transport system permease protein